MPALESPSAAPKALANAPKRPIPARGERRLAPAPRAKALAAVGQDAEEWKEF
jgi:hypothetical protein